MWYAFIAISRKPGRGSLTLIKRVWATARTNAMLDRLDGFGV